MPVEIKYNGSTIANLEGGQTATLPCNGKKMKSDLTVIAPEGGGGGGGGGINIVDELPAVGVEGAIYKLKVFNDIAVFMDGQGGLAGSNPKTLFTATSETFRDLTIPSGETIIYVYVTDIGEIYVLMSYASDWGTLSDLYGGMLGVDFPCLGVITNLDDADTTKTGYYIYLGAQLYTYSNGQYTQLLTKGGLLYTSNNDGTCYVSGLEDYHDAEIVIPSILTSGDTVTGIGEGAFKERSGVTSITIPNSITSIGKEAFQQCKSLDSITIPDGVTSISDSTFSLCTGLDRIIIPNGVTSIGDNAFAFCGYLSSITIPNSVTSIGNYAFNQCYKLGSSSTIKIPDSVTSIGAHAFMYCHSITSIVIPDSVTSIGAYAFAWCHGLRKVTIPSGVASISDDMFRGCSSLTSIAIPDNVTIIGSSAFSGCTNLTSITIPDSVTSIGNGAFRDCTSLMSITIPSSVNEIKALAFYGCTSLTNIAFEGTVEQWKAITKGANWATDVPATKVTCSDGEIIW